MNACGAFPAPQDGVCGGEVPIMQIAKELNLNSAILKLQHRIPKSHPLYIHNYLSEATISVFLERVAARVGPWFQSITQFLPPFLLWNAANYHPSVEG